MASGFFLTISALIWSGLVLLFNLEVASGFYKQHTSTHYQIVTGTITCSEIVRGPKRRVSARIEYTYLVNDQKFSGKKTRFGFSQSSNSSTRATVAKYPMGASVSVYYNPDAPEQSLLEPGISGADFMNILFMTPFNMVMLGLWYGCASMLSGVWGNRATGGARLLECSRGLRIRLPQYGALLAGLVATGATALASFLVVGIPTDMNPSTPTVFVALAVTYGSGFGAFLWRRAKINSGIEDLVIDELSRTLELPALFGRKPGVTFKIDDIKSIYVERIVRVGGKGGVSYRYSPVICFRGNKHPQQIASWVSQKRANVLADWLRQKLGGIPSGGHLKSGSKHT